ncbi:MAG: hydrogenase expression/formation protein HypE [Bacillota bacterium]
MSSTGEVIKIKQNDAEKDIIILSHGDGGLLTHQLLQETFFPLLSNEWLQQEGDAAILEMHGERLAFSTDSFVVSPLFFPGGDIGKLAVCGTVNDLVVSGAKPLWLTAGFIIPEGMAREKLQAVVRSMAETARGLGLPIVAGDTKVVSSNDPDNLFINTTGIGLVYPEAYLCASKMEPSDKVIVSGSIGDHGAAIIGSRLGLEHDESPPSDCAPLTYLLELLRPFFPYIKVMRDPTRGGLATTLKELAAAAAVDLLIEEEKIAVKAKVRAITEITGIDPYYLACEGRAILIVKDGTEKDVLATLQKHPLCREASIIGTVKPGKGDLFLRTALGGTRLMQMLAGTPLPRIC